MKLVLLISLTLGLIPITVLGGTAPILPANWTELRAEAKKLPKAGERFYVDGQTGDDKNVGSSEHPWRTIQKAAETLKSGQIGLVHSGVYHEVVLFEHSGTSSDPIVLAADEGANVVIDGQNTLPTQPWGGLVELRHCSFITIVGLHIINSAYAGVFGETCTDVAVQAVSTDRTWSSGVQFWNSRAINVRGNDIRRACQGTAKNKEGTQECITLASCSDFRVTYNEVYDRTLDVGDGGEGIDAKEACVNGKIDHNVVHDLARLGIYVDAYDKELDGVEVASNIVFRCENGIVISAERSGTARKVQVRGNIVFYNRENGIAISDFVDDGVRTEITIDQNTVARNGRSDWGGGIFVGTHNPLTRDITITRNVVAQNGAWQIAAMVTILQRVLVRDNLIDGFRDYDGGGGGEKEIKGKDAELMPAGFTDPAASNFRLPPDNRWRKRDWGATSP